MITMRICTKRELDTINDFVPIAEKHANSMVDKRHPDWSKIYLQKMNDLTIEAGLRVLMKEVIRKIKI